MNKQAIALLSLGHFLIDFCQGVVPALVPFLVMDRHFSYTAAASLVFAISATSSVVQPLFGQLADRLALPWLLPASVFLAAAALSLGAQSAEYGVVLSAFGLSGLGVAAFHPEAARKAHLASGERRTTGMSLFSVGGGLGFALAPALTTAVLVSWGTFGVAGAPGTRRDHCRSAGLFIQPRCSPVSAPQDGGTESGWTGRLAGVRHPERGDDLPVDCVLRPEHLPGALLHHSLAPDRRTGELALVVFLGTSIVGTLLGGWLADRVGRRTVIRTGFAGAVVFLALFLQVTDRNWALAVLVPLAVFIFMPTSVLVVLGQEYLPHRVGVASGVTLGLAVSVGGMCAPLLGRLATWQGLGFVFSVALGIAAGGDRPRRLPCRQSGAATGSSLNLAAMPVTADLSE